MKKYRKSAIWLITENLKQHYDQSWFNSSCKNDYYDTLPLVHKARSK